MKKLSIKIRLLISFLLVAVSVWVCAATLSWVETRDQMDEFFDTYQILMARQLANQEWHNIDSSSQTKTDKMIDKLVNEGDEEDEAIGFAVFDKQGNKIFHDGENGKNFPYNYQSNGFSNQKINTKDEWRIIWLPSVDGKFVIAVGQELDFRNEAAGELVLQSLFPWLAGLLILLIATFFMVSHSLKPLKNIKENLANREANNLSAINTDNQPIEILPMLNEMNRLFQRIQNMLEQERSFIANAAHELRTPLTALSIQLEVALLSEDDKQSQKQALQNLALGIKRCHRLTEQLLALSKAQSCNFCQDNLQTINWANIIKELQQENYYNADIDCDITASPVEYGNEMLCSMMMRNLIDNATKYGDTKQAIKIIINPNKISISNSAPNLKPQDLQNLAQRFFRPAGQQIQGSGLGLAIVEKIAKLHGLNMSLELIDNNFIVNLSH